MLSVENLKVHFHTREGVVRAVDGVSFALDAGETLGIVGESGSGKSAGQYALLGLLPMPPARIESGRALFEGRDLLHCPARELRAVRGRRIAMIFQDPMTALNPFMRIGAQLAEPLAVHERIGRAAARAQAVEALHSVGIQDAARRLSMYPHEFSGGMRQRVMIAMALIARPALLIADEPTTALDVTVQAQILELIRARQRALGMAMILISHDMGVVAGMCDRVLVMYAGRIVESAPAAELFAAPRHPYTRALLDSMPAARRKGARLFAIPGAPPDLSVPVRGCSFAPRCAHAREMCRNAPCTLEEIAPGRAAACVRVRQIAVT